LNEYSDGIKQNKEVITKRKTQQIFKISVVTGTNNSDANYPNVPSEIEIMPVTMHTYTAHSIFYY